MRERLKSDLADAKRSLAKKEGRLSDLPTTELDKAGTADGLDKRDLSIAGMYIQYRRERSINRRHVYTI